MGGGPPDFPQGSTCLVVLWILHAPFRLRLRGFHPLRLAFPKPFRWLPGYVLQSITPWCTHHGLGSSGFARRYSRNRVFFLFLRLLRCFSSPGSLHTLWIGVWMTEVCSAGFPHSDIHGSRDICSSPWLFAAYHVFLRLSVPRHPPCALLRLTRLSSRLAYRAWFRLLLC